MKREYLAIAIGTLLVMAPSALAQDAPSTDPSFALKSRPAKQINYKNLFADPTSLKDEYQYGYHGNGVHPETAQDIADSESDPESEAVIVQSPNVRVVFGDPASHFHVPGTPRQPLPQLYGSRRSQETPSAVVDNTPPAASGSSSDNGYTGDTLDNGATDSYPGSVQNLTPPPAQQPVQAQSSQPADPLANAIADASSPLPPAGHEDLEGSVPCSDSQIDWSFNHQEKEKGKERNRRLDNLFADMIARANGPVADDSGFKGKMRGEFSPKERAKTSECMVIIPDEKTVALIWGGTYGAGAYKCKDGPNHFEEGYHYIQLEGASKGWQLGAKDTNRVLFMSGDAAKRLQVNDIKVGVGAAVALGPIGKDGSFSLDASLSDGIVSFSNTKGLFAGVSLQGMSIHPDRYMDARMNDQLLTKKHRHGFLWTKSTRNVCEGVADDYRRRDIAENQPQGPSQPASEQQSQTLYTGTSSSGSGSQSGTFQASPCGTLPGSPEN